LIVMSTYTGNDGLFVYHSSVEGNDRLSFYDGVANDHPSNDETDYSYYATSDNWGFNFTVDKVGTESNLDELTSVIK